MDDSGINCTVSLTRCDDMLQIPLLKSDIINSVNTVSMEPKDTGRSRKTTELKRSARLSKKRGTSQDNLITEFSDRLNDSNEGQKPSKILKSKKSKAKIHLTLKNDVKKINHRNFVNSTVNTSRKLRNTMNVQSSLNTTVDNEDKISVKNLPRVFKNKNSSKPPMVTRVKTLSTVYNVNTENGIRSKHEKNDDLVKVTRKRGRPSQKELQLLLRDADKVNTSCSDEIEKKKTGNEFSKPFEKLLDLHESDSSILNENDHLLTAESNYSNDDEPTKHKKNQIGIKSSTANDEIVTKNSCTLKDTAEQVKIAPTVVISKNNKILRDANEPSQDYETFDREILLISNRFNIPCDTLRNIIEKESISVFREKYSDTVTTSMVTVSPVVSMMSTGKRISGRNSDDSSVKYKIEPIRGTVAYEKTSLKDTMEEISKTMPSWSLSIVADPPRYVISHMSIETYGTPIANKSVVLDRYFRASVYIDQRLEYKYCKRYTTASEIVNLIKELDAITK